MTLYASCMVPSGCTQKATEAVSVGAVDDYYQRYSTNRPFSHRSPMLQTLSHTPSSGDGWAYLPMRNVAILHCTSVSLSIKADDSDALS